MKKYIIALFAIILFISMLVAFSVPDRIKCAIYGIAGYDLDDYELTKKDIETQEILIEFSKYTKQPILVYEHNRNVSLILENIAYNGDSYTFCFVSYGSSEFESGEIIYFEENCEDKNIINDCGEFIFQYMGNSSLENNRIEFYFDLYPKNGMYNVEDFSEMTIKIPIEHVVLYRYERL